MTTPTEYDDVTPCRGTCGRPLRPGHVRAADRPGTVPSRAKGYCRACLPADLVGARPSRCGSRPTPPNCRCCGHRMRPHDGTLADHPGTLRHVGGGACSRCYDANGAQAIDPEAVRPDFDETQARASLDSWLTDRSRRLGRVHHFPTPTPDTETERIAA